MTAPRSASFSATTVSKSSSYSSASALSVVSILSSCRSPLSLHQIHDHIVRKDLEQHPVLAIPLPLPLRRFSAPAYTSSAFDRIASPDFITWNALLGAHALHSSLPTIVALFNLLRQRSPVPPDEFAFPSLLNERRFLCPRHHTPLWLGDGCLRQNGPHRFLRQVAVSREDGAARKLFDSLLHRNEVSWTVMFAGYLSSGDLTSARALFDEMPKKNVATSGDLISARALFDEMPVSYTSLIDGYAKAGDLASAKVLSEQSPDKDLFSWSVMISGFAQNGRPGDALKIFLEMHNLNIKADDHIAVGLMSACSQLGNLMLAKWADSYVIKNGIDITKAHVLAALIDMNAKGFLFVVQDTKHRSYSLKCLMMLPSQ